MSAENATDIPLSVAVVGDEVRVLMPDGADLTMSVRAAERSAQRLLDAVALAKGFHPEKLRA